MSLTTSRLSLNAKETDPVPENASSTDETLLHSSSTTRRMKGSNLNLLPRYRRLLISNVRNIYTIVLGRRLAYRMNRTDKLQNSDRDVKSANSALPISEAVGDAHTRDKLRARAIARTIGCIVSSINILRTPTFQIYSITSYCRYY